MPKGTHSPIMNRPYKRQLTPVYVVTLLLTFHTSVVLYINSSYLEQFIPTESVGTMYTIGAAVSLLTLLFISRVLNALGNFKLTLGLILITFISVTGMAFADTMRVAVPLFIVTMAIMPLLFFNLDVFMEGQIGNNEGSTGKTRGLLLSLASLIGAISPLTSGFLVSEATGSFTLAYIASAVTLIPVILLILIFFRKFSEPKYNEVKIFDALRAFWIQKDVKSVFLCNFTLQTFFMFMVIYSPLYLIDNIGLTWIEFGLVMFFAQLAYVILEFPIGIIADKWIGEKEMMAFGFLIMIVSTSWIAFVITPSVVLWSIIMFTTRVGASFVDATTESYFFKQIKASDAQVISIFRINRPLAYVFGALLASLGLLYIPFQLMFIVLAIVMIPALFITLSIKDTK